MSPRTRILAAAILLALMAGLGCSHKQEETPSPQAGTEQSPAVMKALRHAQLRAQRRPRDLAAQLQAGQLSYDSGQYNAAYRAYRQAAEADPKNFEAMVGLARTNLKLLSPTQGLDWVGRARRIKPNDRDLVELEARLNLLAGRIDPALAGFKRATELGPSLASTWLNLASTHGIVREYPQAVAAAQQAVRVTPTSATAHFALGHFLDRNGDKAGAEAEYRRALQLDAKDAAPMVALARLLVGQNRGLTEARTLAIKASQLQADRADAAIIAAWVLHLQGEDRKAGDELIKIVNSMPQTPEAWDKLAVVLRRLGKTPEADRAERTGREFRPATRSTELELLDAQ